MHYRTCVIQQPVLPIAVVCPCVKYKQALINLLYPGVMVCSVSGAAQSLLCSFELHQANEHFFKISEFPLCHFPLLLLARLNLMHKH